MLIINICTIMYAQEQQWVIYMYNAYGYLQVQTFCWTQRFPRNYLVVGRVITTGQLVRVKQTVG